MAVSAPLLAASEAPLLVAPPPRTHFEFVRGLTAKRGDLIWKSNEASDRSIIQSCAYLGSELGLRVRLGCEAWVCGFDVGVGFSCEVIGGGGEVLAWVLGLDLRVSIGRFE